MLLLLRPHVVATFFGPGTGPGPQGIARTAPPALTVSAPAPPQGRATTPR